MKRICGLYVIGKNGEDKNILYFLMFQLIYDARGSRGDTRISQKISSSMSLSNLEKRISEANSAEEHGRDKIDPILLMLQ